MPGVFVCLFLIQFFTQLGEPFDETTPDGREVTAVCTLEGGKIVSVQKAKKEGQKSTRVQTYWTPHPTLLSLTFCLFQSTREMNGPDELIYTMTIDGSDIVCVQKFKRIG